MSYVAAVAAAEKYRGGGYLFTALIASRTKASDSTQGTCPQPLYYRDYYPSHYCKQCVPKNVVTALLKAIINSSVRN